MKDYYKQAQALRQQVAEIDELVHHPIYENEEGDEQKADQLWQEHVELLSKAYPKPDPRDHIQVTLRDIYRDDAVVLSTSFANMKQYNRAYDQLGWDYELDSKQIGQCEWCDEYYLVKNGYQDSSGRGFCKQGCLEEDEFERQMPADEQEYDLFYDYCFPNGDHQDHIVILMVEMTPFGRIHSREIPNW